MATVQVIDIKTQAIKATMPQAAVLPDGRVHLKTKKGLGYLVCRDACEAQGVDPMQVMFRDCGLDVYYRVDQPMHGVVVKLEQFKIKRNPAWKRYNDGQNEGGEGYNPHSKYIND